MTNPTPKTIKRIEEYIEKEEQLIKTNKHNIKVLLERDILDNELVDRVNKSTLRIHAYQKYLQTIKDEQS